MDRIELNDISSIGSGFDIYEIHSYLKGDNHVLKLTSFNKEIKEIMYDTKEDIDVVITRIVDNYKDRFKENVFYEYDTNKWINLSHFKLYDQDIIKDGNEYKMTIRLLDKDREIHKLIEKSTDKDELNDIANMIYKATENKGS